MSTTRRGFLRRSAAALAGMTLLPGHRAVADVVSAAAAARPEGEAPRRIIFLVSDGMSIGVPSLTENLSLAARGRGTHFVEMLKRKDVARGFMETYSLNSLVTDSAAASCAWGSGSRINNNAVNILPDGTRLRPVLNILKEMGYATGLVTTASVTHATPAGFASVQEHRSHEVEIAPQYLDVVDVILGGGTRFYAVDKRSDHRDVAGEYATAGYKVVRDRASLASATSADKVLGLFADNYLPYTVDHQADEQLLREVPTLAEMTGAALEILDRNPDGFLVQVEGARVDHGAHRNDAAGTMWDQLAFDDAIGVALEYAAERPGTLVVVTTDHANSNPGLNSSSAAMLPPGGGVPKCIELMAQATCSVEQFDRHLREAGDFSESDLRDLIKQHYNVEVQSSEAEIVHAAWRRENTPIISRQHQNFNGALGQVLGNYTGIGWCGTSHTEDYVLVAAAGIGQDRYSKLIRNTDFFDYCGNAFGFEFRNKSMEPEQARKLSGATPALDPNEHH